MALASSTVPAAGAHRHFVGERVLYWSVSQKSHVEARVLKVDPASGRVELDVKPGAWVEESFLQPLPIFAPAPRGRSDGSVLVARTRASTVGSSPPIGGAAPEEAPRASVPGHVCHGMGKKVSYFSQSNGSYVVATVIDARPADGAVQLDVKPGVWIDVAEQAAKIRELYVPGVEVEYLSESNHCWIAATVVSIRADDGHVELNVKRGVFVLPEKVRLAHRAPQTSAAWFRDAAQRAGKGDARTSTEQHLRSARRGFDAKYDMGKLLACGAGGAAYVAKERASGIAFVVKRPHDAKDTEDYTRLVGKEHPNIVRVFDLFASPVETFVVMEFCGGGDLFHALQVYKRIFDCVSFNFMAGVMRQAMTGVNHLHEVFQLCHNDIKPENILLHCDPCPQTPTPRCMIADFGCATPQHAPKDGDPRYNAPELWLGGRVSFASDVWSLGVTLYEMLSGGLMVFTGQRNVSGWASFCKYGNGVLYRSMETAMKTGQQPKWAEIEPAGQLGKDLCACMLQRRREDRVLLSYLVGGAGGHPWLELAHQAELKIPDSLLAGLHSRAGCSEIKMLLLNLVAGKLQGESLDYYRHIWQRFEEDKDGRMSEAEFLKMMTSPDIGLSHDRAVELFGHADVDGSSYVDFKEFVAVMFNPRELTTQRLEEQVVCVFSSMAGSDESLSFDSFCAAFLSPEGSDRRGDMLRRLFDEIDADGNGSITQEEFKEFVSKM